jgi:hypothetical protein
MESKCADCAWRKKAEEKPNTWSARIWRWHTKFCPAWKAYQRELNRQEQQVNQ